jgi:parallel beta-helix repeat protein
MLVRSGTFNDITHNRVDGYVSCNIYEHETAAYLSAPAYIKPGYSCLISGTVANRGLHDEKDVALQLLLDGEVVNSTTVDSLSTGSLADLTYLFTPTQEGTYSWEMRVRPVPNEEYTENNLASASIRVRSRLTVPQDYPTIQEAIADAVAGETVAVGSGTYYEHVGIDKPLTIIGEDCNTTIIDGGDDNRAVIVIHADNVSLMGFTIRNGGNGIFLDHSNGTVITNNVVTDTMDAVFVQFSYNNTITFNTIKDNDGGIFLSESSDNVINHNAFINNNEQAWTMDSHNVWDDGQEGNYWSNYNGGDSNRDRIGDTPYIIDQDNRDNYPLIGGAI